MGTEDQAVVARNGVRRRVEYKRARGNLGRDETVLYLDFSDFTKLYAFVKTQNCTLTHTHTHKSKFYGMLIIPHTK